ncbi:response regulator transcription factor [bacterium]|nr:response regulator transcription factor [bacterium]
MKCDKKKVLVIDDNPDIGDLVERALEGPEFEVFKATGGQEGIHMAQEQKVDIILLDIMMPELDGFTVSSYLKKKPATEKIPIIFLTARATGSGRMIASKAGAVDYIMKPFSPRELLKRITRIVNNM